MTAHRKPPLPASFKAPRVWGTCRWCGEPTGDQKRCWHPACLDEYRLLNRTKLQAQHVESRDRGICRDCGKARFRIARWSSKNCMYVRYDVDLGRMQRMTFAQMAQRWERKNADLRSHLTNLDDLEDQHWGPCNFVAFEPDWEVDHEVPLWKVADLPDDQRLWYFTLANLATRCRECHKRKSARESAERAKLKRIVRSDGMRRPKQRGREPLPF